MMRSPVDKISSLSGVLRSYLILSRTSNAAANSSRSRMSAEKHLEMNNDDDETAFQHCLCLNFEFLYCLLFIQHLNDKSLTHFLHGNLSQFIRSCLKCNHKSSIFCGHSVKPLSPGLFTIQQVTLLQLKFPLEEIHLLNNIG